MRIQEGKPFFALFYAMQGTAMGPGLQGRPPAQHMARTYSIFESLGTPPLPLQVCLRMAAPWHAPYVNSVWRECCLASA